MVPALFVELQSQLNFFYTISELEKWNSTLFSYTYIHVFNWFGELSNWIREHFNWIRELYNSIENSLNIRGSVNLVGWLRIFTSLWRYFSHITTWRQEITNLWNHSGKVGIEPRTSCIPSQALYHYIKPPLCSFGIPYIFDEDCAIVPSHKSLLHNHTSNI